MPRKKGRRWEGGRERERDKEDTHARTPTHPHACARVRTHTHTHTHTHTMSNYQSRYEIFNAIFIGVWCTSVCIYYIRTYICMQARTSVCVCVCVCVWMCACVCVCECIHARVYAGATNDMAFPKSHQNDTLQSHPTSTPFAPEIAPKPNPQITELLVCTLGWMKGVCVCVGGGGLVQH